MSALLRLVGRALDHPYRAVAVAAILFGAAVACLPRLTVAGDGRRLFAPSHPAVVADARADRLYGPAHQLIVGVIARTEEGLFHPRTLDLVWDLTSRIRSLAGVDRPRVKSVSTVMAPVNTSEGLVVAPALEGPRPTPAEAAAVHARVLGDSLLRRILLSRDRRGTFISVPLVPEANPLAVLDSLVEVLRYAERDARAMDIRLDVMGSVAAEALLGDHVLADLAALMPAAFAVIVVVLSLWFRRAAIVAVGLAESMLVVVATLALMAVTDRALSLVSIVMPVILASYCLSDTVHVAQRYVLLRQTYPSGKAAMQQVIAELGRPVVFTSLATAAGFIALAGSPIPALADFGVFTAAGVLVALAVSLFVVPSALVLLDPSVSRKCLRNLEPVRARLASIAMWVASHPGATVATALLLTTGAAAGMLRLTVQDSWTGNFSAGSEIRRSDRWLNEQMGGSGILRVVLRAAPGELVTDPSFLARLDAFAGAVKTRREVGEIVTAADHMQAVGRLVGSGYRVPETAAEAEEWWLLLESAGGAETMAAYVDAAREAACVWIYVRDPDYGRVSAVLKTVEHAWNGVRPELGGDAFLGFTLVHEIAVAWQRSLLGATALIAIVTYTMLRSVRSTLLALVPVALALVWNFGALGWAGVPIGVATSTFSAIAFGIGIDFALHWLERYKLAVARRSSAVEALKETAEWAGPAIVAQGGLLTAAFGVLLASRVPPVRQLGLLMCTNIVVCVAATVVLVPTLQSLLARGARALPSASPRAAEGACQ